VRRGFVVSASGCCTAVPGWNPARHPSLGSAQENPGAEKYQSRFFPAQQQEIPAQQQAYQPIAKDEYCINTVDRKINKNSAGKGTKCITLRTESFLTGNEENPELVLSNVHNRTSTRDGPMFGLSASP
jgi:hypothetical protein